jgi:hypothetical protein
MGCTTQLPKVVHEGIGGDQEGRAVFLGEVQEKKAGSYSRGAHAEGLYGVRQVNWDGGWARRTTSMPWSATNWRSSEEGGGGLRFAHLRAAGDEILVTSDESAATKGSLVVTLLADGRNDAPRDDMS